MTSEQASQHGGAGPRDSAGFVGGAVVIGRNEGERLRRCLASLRRASDGAQALAPIVYVDSGSTDGSVAMARELGVEVHDLDTSIKFTAARARNVGARRLLELAPDTAFIQFIDGDCELDPGWIAAAFEAIEKDPRRAVVCGRRRERYPDRSIYNALCDLEWDSPIGLADACGGDALIRVAAYREVGGYRDDLIAGEEPEMCLRMRRAGWTIERIDAEMTLHDAAMTTASQWWQRAKRAGYAWAEGYALHGAQDGYRRREVISTLGWALGPPTVSLPLAPVTGGLSMLGLGAYPLLGLKVYRHGLRRGFTPAQARLYAASAVASKFPQAAGMLKYAWNRARNRQGTLIEYKGAGA
jgi:GT2 family glycosyltransferase